MSGFVSAENILTDQQAATREEVLRAIAGKAAELGICDDADALCQAFLAREEMGETGMTGGFAIPHAKCGAIKRAGVVVFKNAHPVEWPSFDEKPVDIAIALMVPGDEEGTEHIRLLSRAAELLMDEGFKRLVRAETDPARIAEAVADGIEG